MGSKVTKEELVEVIGLLNAASYNDEEKDAMVPILAKKIKTVAVKEIDLRKAFMNAVQGIPAGEDDEHPSPQEEAIPEKVATVFNTLREEEDAAEAAAKKDGGAAAPAEEKKTDVKADPKKKDAAKATEKAGDKKKDPAAGAEKKKSEKKGSAVDIMKGLLAKKTPDAEIAKVFGEYYAAKGQKDKKFIEKRIAIYKDIAAKELKKTAEKK